MQRVLKAAIQHRAFIDRDRQFFMPISWLAINLFEVRFVDLKRTARRQGRTNRSTLLVGWPRVVKALSTLSSMVIGPLPVMFRLPNHSSPMR